jgi:hypothetical protein
MLYLKAQGLLWVTLYIPLGKTVSVVVLVGVWWFIFIGCLSGYVFKCLGAFALKHLNTIFNRLCKGFWLLLKLM